MTPEELSELANKVLEDDPNTAIVLLVLSASKYNHSDDIFAQVAQEFAKNRMSQIKYDKWIEEG